MLSLLTLVGGLCYGTVASASTVTMPGMDMQHCSGQITMLKQGTPMNNAIMPCCVDRHDNIPTTLTPELKDQIKFSDVSVALIAVQSVADVSQKTYASSPSPPPEPDVLFSIFKKE